MSAVWTDWSKNKLETVINRLVIKRIRTCLSRHDCMLCTDRIQPGDRYFDGGYGRRAHVRCVREARGKPA